MATPSPKQLLAREKFAQAAKAKAHARRVKKDPAAIIEPPKPPFKPRMRI